MVWKVFLQCIPFEFGREQVFRLSVRLGLLMNSCSSLAATSFLRIISETARDSSNHFCYPWLKAACQNVSSVSVARIRVLFPTHGKLGDFKGFPCLLQDSSRKSDFVTKGKKCLSDQQLPFLQVSQNAVSSLWHPLHNLFFGLKWGR